MPGTGKPVLARQTILEEPRGNAGGAFAGESIRIDEGRVRLAFWIVGIVLAVMQAWTARAIVTADAIMYLDMSDGVTSGWQRLINAIWSPLYPWLLGLARMVLPGEFREIAMAHYVNVIVFVFTFACYEFFLKNLLDAGPERDSSQAKMPRGAFLVMAYSIFLWSCIGQVTLKSLRPDMLMDGLLLLAAGIVVRILCGAPTWPNFLGLGVVLGVAYLAKAPMLVIGMILLAFTLVQWRQTLVKAVAAGVLLLAIGSLYYVPLSKQLGHFSLGESSSYNYLFHVNHASPSWYLNDIGSGKGKFLRAPARIYDNPPAYEFHYPQVTTHPLRFDPVYWTLGAKPRFTLSGQVWAVLENTELYAEMLLTAGGILAGVLLLWFVSAPGIAARQWAVWTLGLLGVAMYAAVHVEERYVGIFFSLMWLGLLAGMRFHQDLSRRIVPAVALGVAFSVLLPIGGETAYRFLEAFRSSRTDPDTQVATELRRMGVQPGTPVARVSYMVTDLGWARLSRSTIVAEVEYERGDDFWESGEKTQGEVLEAFSRAGAKYVIGHPRGASASPGWQRLGKTHFWIRPL